MNELFPIFIKADQINILIIGGGKVAMEKLHFLLKSSPNASIQLVAVEIDPGLLTFVKDRQNISVEIRYFVEEDVEGKHLLIAATNNEKFNDYIRLIASQKKILLNVADKASLCDFYLGGIVTRGDLKMAISTNGKSPILTSRLREFFETELPETLEEVINDLQGVRQKLNGSFAEKLEKLKTATKYLIDEHN